MSKYKELRSIDVTAEIKKMGKFNYLPWAYCVDTLLQHDPEANWVYGEPQIFNGTMMVNCSVTAFGKTMTEYLPVKDNSNKSITNPNAMQINNAMKRCLVKCIAICTGIGLSLYAGDEFWDEPEETLIDEISKEIDNCQTKEELIKIFGEAWKQIKSPKDKKAIQTVYEKRKVELNATSTGSA